MNFLIANLPSNHSFDTPNTWVGIFDGIFVVSVKVSSS